MSSLFLVLLLALAYWTPLTVVESTATTVTRISSSDSPRQSALVDADSSNSSKLQMLINYSPHYSNSSLLRITQNSTRLTPDQLKALRDEYDNIDYNTHRNKRIGYGFAYGLIIVISFFGNLLVCKVCLKNMTKTNALIMSLAASDLLMTLFNIPFNYFKIASFSWPFGSVICFVVNFIQFLVVYISSYTMAIIAVQRYRSVTGLRFETAQANRISKQSSEAQPDHSLNSNKFLNYAQTLYTSVRQACMRAWSNCRTGSLYQSNQLFSMRAIFITIVITWLLSALISAFFTFPSIVIAKEDFFSLYLNVVYNQSDRLQSNSNNSDDSQPQSKPLDDTPIYTILRCQNRLPEILEYLFRSLSIEKVDFALTVTVFITQYFIPLTISCFLYIRIGKIITRQGKLTSLRGNPKARIRQKKKRRRIVMLVLVVAVFAICWLPIHIYHLLVDSGQVDFNEQVFMGVHWLSMSSVCYNPFIYCWLNKGFRKAALRVFCCCWAEADQSARTANGTGAAVGGVGGSVVGGTGSGNADDCATVGLMVREKVLQQVTCFGRNTSAKRNSVQELHTIQTDQTGASNSLAKTDKNSPNEDSHKLSNISVMTESTVIPFSANMLEEITSATNVSYDKLDQFKEEEYLNSEHNKWHIRVTKDKSTNSGCDDSGTEGANCANCQAECHSNQSDNDDHHHSDNELESARDSCIDICEGQQPALLSHQQPTRTNGTITTICDETNSIFDLKDVDERKENYDKDDRVEKRVTTSPATTAKEHNKQGKQFSKNNILCKQCNEKSATYIIDNEDDEDDDNNKDNKELQSHKINRNHHGPALGQQKQDHETEDAAEDEANAVLNDDQEYRHQNGLIYNWQNNNGAKNQKPQFRHSETDRQTENRIELQLLTNNNNNPQTQRPASDDKPNSAASDEIKVQLL